MFYRLTKFMALTGLGVLVLVCLHIMQLILTVEEVDPAHVSLGMVVLVLSAVTFVSFWVENKPWKFSVSSVGVMVLTLNWLVAVTLTGISGHLYWSGLWVIVLLHYLMMCRTRVLLGGRS
jgi:hypothetical protein